MFCLQNVSKRFKSFPGVHVHISVTKCCIGRYETGHWCIVGFVRQLYGSSIDHHGRITFCDHGTALHQSALETDTPLFDGSRVHWNGNVTQSKFTSLTAWKLCCQWRVSGWVFKFNGLSRDSGQRGPYRPYKPCNHSLNTLESLSSLT